MNATWLLRVGGALLLLASTSRADRLELALSGPTVIADEAGFARVLFQQPDLTALEDHLVFSAHLEFQIPQVIVDRDLDVQVNPISTAWSEGSTSWTVPWSNPGGDRDDRYFRSSSVPRGGGVFRLDVTSLVRATLERELDSHGFVLSVPYQADAVGFRALELSRLGTLGSGRLVIEHRKFRTPREAREGGRAEARTRHTAPAPEDRGR
jgi:hypothetical protein